MPKKKKSSRGGARKGAGRKLQEDVKQSKVLQIPLTPDNFELIKKVGGTKWAKQVLVRAAKRRIKRDKDLFG